MKKITLFIFTIILSVAHANAQDQPKEQEETKIQQGNILLGGNFSFYSDKVKSGSLEDSEIQLSISPVVGTMISDKVAIGVSLGYLYTKYEDNDPNSYRYPDKTKFLVIAPFVRIHNDITENFKYFIEPNLGKIFDLNDETDNKTQRYTAGVNFGLLYFISQKMSLELNVAGINYTYTSNKDYDFKRNTVSVDYDLVTPNIGLKYYF